MNTVRDAVTADELRPGDHPRALPGHRVTTGPTEQADGRWQVRVTDPAGNQKLAAIRPGIPLDIQREPRAGDLVRYETTGGGTLVQVMDCNHPDSPAGPDVSEVGTYRWGTLCVPHGGWIQHTTLKLAISFACAPAEWCPDCAPTAGN